MSFALAVSMVTPMVCMPGMSVYAEEESVDIVADDEEGEVSSEEESTEEQQPTVNLVYDDFVEILLGATKDLTVNATSTVSGSTLTYQWYKDIKDQETPELIDGATSNVLTITGEANVVGYSCEVSDGTTDNVASFTISLNSGLVVNETSDSVDVSLNETATMEVTAASSTGRTITYQWKKYDAITDSYTDIAGATSNKYEVQGAKGMVNKYLCVVSDGISEISDGITTVEAEYTVILDTGLDVTYNPEVDLKYGDNAELKVNATCTEGQNITYQWYAYKINAETEEVTASAIEGANTDTLSIKADENSAPKYMCKVTDGISVIRSVFDINIDTGLTLSAKKSVVSAEYSTTARLEVSASTKIASGVKYQWYEYVYDETEKKYFYDECEGQDATLLLTLDGSTAGKYKCSATDGVNSKSVEIELNVLQRDIAKASVELDETLYTFNGVAKKPELFIEDGEYFLEEYKDYVISYENNIYPGTAKVVITGRGGYVGSITKTFKINAVKISSLKMTKQTNKSITFTFKKSSVSVDGYIILRADKKNGTYKKIAVTKSTSYTDKKSLKGRTNFYYKVCGYKLVSGKQVVCASSSIVNMTRKPDATRLTVKAGKGKATVKMSKVVGATGYELYMSTSKNGKYKKIATVTKAKSVTKKGLKKGKKYYFKAKVITKSDSKKKFISAYSAAKSVKIK